MRKKQWITVGKYYLNKANISHFIYDKEKKHIVVVMRDGARIDVMGEAQCNDFLKQI